MENEKNISATIYLPIFEYIFAIKAINQLEFFCNYNNNWSANCYRQHVSSCFLFVFEKCLFTIVIVRDHKKYDRDK